MNPHEIDDAEVSARFDQSDFDDQNVIADGVDSLDALQQPFVGQWNTLISTTNWEKGRIIAQWRMALIAAGAAASEYSDEAWSARVGGVTAPHVGRLRRVFTRFDSERSRYSGLFWSHFLAAIDWDDAALWLQGAVEENWSVALMRNARWKANGELEGDRPQASQIIDVETEEESLGLGTAPAQGDSKRREYDGDAGDTASGPRYDSPDFGDEPILEPMSQLEGDAEEFRKTGSPTPTPSQPFAGLPALPDDLSDVIETLKLAILRHKTQGYRDCPPDVIHRYLEAVMTLIES